MVAGIRSRAVRFGARLAALALVAVVLVAAPAQAAVGIAVTPSSNLVDGQVVDVQLTGLPAYFPSAGVLQCVGIPSMDTCDTGSLRTGAADAIGNFNATLTASAILVTNTYGVVDCRTPPVGSDCVIAGGTDINNIAVQVTTFDPLAPLRPPPSLTATPDTGLVDGQTVVLDGSGYTPGEYLSAMQCPTGTVGYVQCRYALDAPVVVGPAGTIDAAVVVKAQFFADNQIIDCQAAPGACEVRIPGAREHLTARTPISFDPLGPPTPLPTMSVTPDTGLIDLQTVHVSGAGFPTAYVGTTDPAIPPVMLAECLVNAPFTCVSAGMTVPDAGGAISVDLDVQAAIFSYDDNSVHDCRPAAGLCRLVAMSYGAPDVGAVASLTFDPVAPLAPPPSLAPAPATNLVDGQIIDVTGSGFVGDPDFPGIPIPFAETGADLPLRWNDRLGAFTPDIEAIRGGAGPDADAPQKLANPGFTSVRQCVAALPGWSGCDDSTGVGVPFDGDGNLAMRFQVHATITAWNVGVEQQYDCRVVACVLRAGDLGNPLREAEAAIAFDPSAPLAPPPSLTVTPAEGLLDGQLVHMTGANFPWRSGVQVPISQCAAYPSPSDNCGVNRYLGDVEVAEDGTFAIDVRVSAGVEFPQVDCRVAVGTCTLATYLGGNDWDPSVPLGFDPSGPLDPQPEVSVSPATDLVVGQSVVATGRWFTSADQVEVVQCADGWLLTPLRCDPVTARSVTTDDVGTVASTVTLARMLTMSDGSTVDCTVEVCALLITNPEIFGEVAWAPLPLLGLSPGGTAPPPPVVLTPSFAG